MPQSLLPRIDVRHWQNRIQTELERRSEEWLSRRDEFLGQVDRQKDTLLGKVRDQSYRQAYDISARALRQFGEALAAAHQHSPLKLDIVRSESERLQRSASDYEQRRLSVDQPAIADYDELNVGEVNQRLDSLSYYQLCKLRDYESAHKNRITILREVDQRLGV